MKEKNIYDFKANTIEGKEISMAAYKNKVILIVNTASKCGFTPQLKVLEELFQKYKDRDFEILAFPCNQFLAQEPQGNEDILSFCQINYGVTFQMFEKINVNGTQELPLYRFLKEKQRGKFGNQIKWNFTKFLVNRDGIPIARFAPTDQIEEVENMILKTL